MFSSIDQLLPNLNYGDAVSHQALEIRNLLREKGFNSQIFVQNLDPKMKEEACLISEEWPNKGSAIIYHHSIGSDIVERIKEHKGPKFCIYHNITPSNYFWKYNSFLHNLTLLGRDQLSIIREFTGYSFGVSEYNCEELKQAGFRNVDLLPIIVDPIKWELEPDTTVLENYGSSLTTNILFVGRITPNKCQKDLVRFFYFFSQLVQDSRLFLVGNYEETDLYFLEVKKEIKRLNLEDRIVMTGLVSTAKLKSYYQISDLFLSLSEHEGFGVPLIEAMWFDIPVIAYKSSAIPETLGEAAFMIQNKGDLKSIALLAKYVLYNHDLKNKIILAQQKRRSAFIPENIRPFMEKALETMTQYSFKEKDKTTINLNVCFIVQRYGKEVNGGAELLCRLIAEKMAKYWNIDIVTTCALDHLTWKNSYPSGIEYMEQVKIHRFMVDHPRSLETFGTISNRIISRDQQNCSLDDQEEWVIQQGPYSTNINHYLIKNKDKYDLFIFFTYLYATTYFGLPEVSKKACLVPTAHDEWPIYLPIYHNLFSKTNHYVFNTPEEKSFLIRLYPDLSFEGPISGVGIEKPLDIEEIRFRKMYQLSDPFIFYLGRIEEAKGCDVLFNYFQRFKKNHPSNLKLVLAGRSAMKIPDDPDIIHLGFVDEQTKWDALAACRLLVNPSLYESLSMVLLEAWSLGKPVLVNEDCEVLKNQTKRANGGKCFNNYNSFSSGLIEILETEEYLAGAEDFVAHTYCWEKIEKDYLNMAETIIKTQGADH